MNTYEKIKEWKKIKIKMFYKRIWEKVNMKKEKKKLIRMK